MKKGTFVPQILTLAVLSMFLFAQAESSYDYKTRTRYTSTATYNGTKVKATNYETGNTWTTTYKKDGNMTGTDSDGNRWRYNKSSGTYYNYGTGEMRRKGKCYYNCD